MLHVQDLVDAMERVAARRRECSGQVYNVGGGPERAISVQGALREIERRTGLAAEIHTAPQRPGDQQIYISNTGKLEAHTGWQPTRSLDRILRDIADFWTAHLDGRALAAPAEPEPQLAALQGGGYPA